MKRCFGIGSLSFVATLLAACSGEPGSTGAESDDGFSSGVDSTTSSSSSDTSGVEDSTGASGDGDGDVTTGDGDGEATGGDGDGDGSTGDGDGDTDSTTGDGDGDADGGDGDGDGDTDSGDGDTDSGDGDDGCFNEQFEFEPLPPSIVLVLDQSGSMDTLYDHDGDSGTPSVSRWQALHIAVTDVLAQFDGQVEFGVKLFPSDADCGVTPGMDAECAPGNAANILATIPAAAADMDGLTPSGEGLSATLNYLQPLVTEGAKAIIFMADGDVNCGTPDSISAIQTLLSGAYNGGTQPSIPTYVVGINATGSTVGELSTLAVAGGVPLPVGDPGCEYEQATVAVPAGTSTITFTYDKDGSVDTGLDRVWIDELSLDVGGTIEWSDGFESGDFSGGSYTQGGNLPWVVDSVEPPFMGTFHAHSGAIDHNQTSVLNLQVNASAAGTLTFNYRTDTESNYDELTVDLNGAQQYLFDGSTAETCAAQFYDAQNTAEFYDALSSILTGLVSCDLPLDPLPPIPENIDVEVDGMLVPELDPGAAGFDCETQSGWYYSAPDTVTLCGQVCEDFKNMSMPEADITYYCTPG